jgi:hypothetical protein
MQWSCITCAQYYWMAIRGYEKWMFRDRYIFLLQLYLRCVIMFLRHTLDTR